MLLLFIVLLVGSIGAHRRGLDILVSSPITISLFSDHGRSMEVVGCRAELQIDAPD